jgi:glycosyltransferase involved in cell wall biosynthesis/putative flippase GtrA
VSLSTHPAPDRPRAEPASRFHRPAVVENVDDPQSTSDGRTASSANDRPVVEIVVPVYNEERALASSVSRLRAYVDARLPFPVRITIADNASTDDTWEIAARLEREIPGVRALLLARKGGGRALRAVWLASDAAVVAYMDVDLSTDLDALLPLVAPLLSGHSDVAIGSRLARGARVVRGPKRELISRSYNRLLQTVLRVGFRDAQCGFKALRRDVARVLLPLVEDDAWFFDTELLVLAERAGLRIHELPVDWIDDPDSRVAIVSTATDDLRGIWRLLRTRRHVMLPGIRRRAFPHRTLGSQVRRFAAIGVASTAAWAVLYLLLRGSLTSVPANAVALVVTAIGNTAANRRLTFGVRGRPSLLRDHAAGLAAFGLALGLTSGAAIVLDRLAPGASRIVEIGVLAIANLVATAARFVLLRTWIGRPAGTRPASVILHADLERTTS